MAKAKAKATTAEKASGAAELAKAKPTGSHDPETKPTVSDFSGEAQHTETPVRTDLPPTVKLRVWRGEGGEGQFVEYEVPREEGMVVLDAVHRVQALHSDDLAVRWNCKAGKCGSCSAEVNGMPRLMCMTRLDVYDPYEAVTVAPIKAFPRVKDLVTDVSWNYRVNQRIAPFTPKPLTDAEKAKGELNMMQRDIDRIQEFRKCIECFLCQNVCHVLREADQKGGFYGPRFMIRLAGLDMHPRDAVDRVPLTKEDAGIGYCNITKCCTEVCPEHIQITDNGIIPMKERVADRYYDPVQMLWRKISGKDKDRLPAARPGWRL